MRLAILVLFFATGTAACCQSNAPVPWQLNQTPVFPPGTFQASHDQASQDLTKLQRDFQFRFVPSQTFSLPTTVTLASREKAKIDPKMVVHPPQSDIGDQASGTLVAQNLFPGLQQLPIDMSKATVKPIPLTWPNMKMENIPTNCPDCKVVLMEKSPATEPAGK